MTTRNLLVRSATHCSINSYFGTNPHTFNSMLRRLLSSSSKFIHINPNSPFKFRPIFLLPSSSLNSPIRVFAMAGKDQTFATSTSGQQSHQNKHTNRLASEHSPYLLQHAHNPVNWYPWGEEAFKQARERDVPIFLSIGYSTCHWCHVMEVESFEDDGVDREERPDVDKPLMGGTYFPPDDKYGRPGFKTVLRKVKEAWESKKDVLVKSGTFAIEQLSEALSSSAISDKLSDGLAQTALRECTKALAESYDPKFGGFGSAPKFPRPSEPQSMIYRSKKLEESGKTGEAEEYLKMVSFSLQCMARGQLANVYLDVFSITKDVFYSRVARDILDYLRRDMIGPNGEIFSAEDADSAESENSKKKKEGAFYVWTNSEVDDIVGDHATHFKEHYYVKKSGNCDLSQMSDPHNEFEGKNVLIERNSASVMASKFGMPLENYHEILGVSRKKLFDARSKRPRPHLDDKVIVSWNGLAISSFARASKILKNEPDGTKFHFPPEDYMQVAKRALSFIKENLYDQQSRRLQHSFRNGPSKAPGFLDDYAFLISGLLDVYEYGGEISWLSWALELQETQDEVFLDKTGGGYFNTTGEDESVLLRVKEDHDGAEPSGNSAVFEKRLKEAPVAVPLMCCAADMLSVPSKKQVVLVGKKATPEMEGMLVSVHASYDLNKTIGFWKEKNPNVAAMAKSNVVAEKAVALVCRDFACKAPITDPRSLEASLLKGKA
ncbi:protein of unknown function DUF255 [Cynara cardunculus var. scolymus]|uniref:Spermatogenesis-associated protein 20-like TRX domain-containing protein n=1 Tax=Cynara cardunculus var. scolymus TaxID=59895 RepID=A0A103YNX4_CYNCS|nr:protein of unknown function DUF255 [Cynara cardunculus var. scolymus]